MIAAKPVSADGAARDDCEYPLDAWRELISNSLVHRDLAEWSRGYEIEVPHYPDKLVIANPGGLFRISVDRLGQEGVTSPATPSCCRSTVPLRTTPRS